MGQSIVTLHKSIICIRLKPRADSTANNIPTSTVYFYLIFVPYITIISHRI